MKGKWQYDRKHSFHPISRRGGRPRRAIRRIYAGLPLRCVYCHNPDTWLTEGGTPTDVDELVRKALRFRPYWKNGGGVTVTGGEPLLQAEFVEEFFARLHEHGVHTALDTSGVGNLSKAEKVLAHTDLVLCDLKFLTKADYLKNCRADFDQIERTRLTAMLVAAGFGMWLCQSDRWYGPFAPRQPRELSQL
ncbi:MAG: radical SAM protein [Butyricicoccaceae bacterium]